MGIFQGDDWKEENVAFGLTWIAPELGDCGCFTMSCIATPQRVEETPNPKFKGHLSNDHMQQWAKVEENFFSFMDQQPVVKCCFGQCDDGVDRQAAVEALNRDWIPKANEQINGANNLKIDAVLFRHVGGGAETRTVLDIIIRFIVEESES